MSHAETTSYLEYKMKLILKILLSTIAVIITANLLNGVTIGDNQFYKGQSDELNRFITALLVAVVLSFLNTIVKPILTVLSLPITFYTLGLFLLVINALIILFANKLVDGFNVDGFWTALWFSLILSFTNSILERLFRNKDND